MLKRSQMHPYQVVGVQHIIENPSSMLLLEMGLGKTVTTLTAVRDLIDGLDISSALVVAPKRVIENVWHRETEKWEHLRGLRTSRVIGSEKQRKHALAVRADIYLISRDNLAWLIGLYGGLKLPFDMLILDESSSFKNHASQRFKALRKVRPCFSRVVALTGTPAPNGLIDLWAQMYLVDQGKRLGKFITEFRNAYFFTETYGQFAKYKARKDSKELIFKRIEDITISMKSADYLDLPDRIFNDVKIAMTPEVAKGYKKFEAEQVLQLLSGEEITAATAAAVTNKLLQFANGALYDEHKKWHAVHDLKLQALEEILESAAGNPVLVAYTFQHDAARIAERFKSYLPVHIGEKNAVDRWNAGEIELLYMHPASGGHGLNLQDGGHTIVWFGHTWSLELEQQFNARLHRQGQTKPVIIHRLILEGSMDEDVLKAIDDKTGEQEAVMQAVKYRLDKYR